MQDVGAKISKSDKIAFKDPETPWVCAKKFVFAFAFLRFAFCIPARGADLVAWPRGNTPFTRVTKFHRPHQLDNWYRYIYWYMTILQLKGILW